MSRRNAWMNSKCMESARKIISTRDCDLARITHLSARTISGPHPRLSIPRNTSISYVPMRWFGMFMPGTKSKFSHLFPWHVRCVGDWNRPESPRVGIEPGTIDASHRRNDRWATTLLGCNTLLVKSRRESRNPPGGSLKQITCLFY